MKPRTCPVKDKLCLTHQGALFYARLLVDQDEGPEHIRVYYCNFCESFHVTGQEARGRKARHRGGVIRREVPTES